MGRRYKIRNVPEKVMVCSTNESPENEDVTKESENWRSEDLTLNSTTAYQTGDSMHNNITLSFAGGSIAILIFLIIGFAGVKVYKAKFSRRRNFNYTLSKDNGSFVGDESRV